MLHTNVHSWYAHDTSFGSARPSVEKIPNLALPFYPRSCGCFDYERGFRREESGRQKPMVHLFWGVKGRGRFETMYGTFDFREGDFFYLLLSNKEMKKQVLGIFADEIYKNLRNAN